MAARISQSRFEFFGESASTATQVMEEATPTTTLKYVESQSCVWMDGERHELEPRQRLIILALLEDLDHELDKDALQRKCGSQSQSFSPSKEFERNKSVYKRFIRYLRDDERYQLLIPLEDLLELPQQRRGTNCEQSGRNVTDGTLRDDHHRARNGSDGRCRDSIDKRDHRGVLAPLLEMRC